MKKELLLGIFLFVHLPVVDGVEECKPPCLYVSNLTAILQIPLNGNIGTPVKKKPDVFLHTSGHIRSLEIDPIKKEIYWGDLMHHTINMSSIDGKQQRTLFQYAIGHPQGIAVDWSTNNIYWTDSLMDLVEVADTRGYNRKVLFDLHEDAEPRGIVAHPVKGFLFWTDWGKRPRIERSTLSGENRTTIISESVIWPNDLAIDYKNERLFWLDAKLDALYSSQFDGEMRITHYELTYNGGRPHPYSLAYSSADGFAYFSDWHTDSVYFVEPLSKKNISLIFENNFIERNIGQVRFLTEFNQTASNPCNEQQCSHMCLKSGPDTAVCDCPTGMKLSADQKNCTSVPRDYEIYFVDSYARTVNHLVKYRNQSGYKVRPLSVPSNEYMEGPLALDYDPDQKTIYWTDRLNGKTYRMHEDGTKFEVLFDHRIASYGLAVDRINNLLYWFENRTNLVVSTLDGENKKTLVKNLHVPRDIALHEELGYVYFSDLANGYVHRINSDGTKLLSLRSRRGITAFGIAVDKIGERVYWCDPNRYSIESVDLNFKNYRKVVQKTIYYKSRFWLTDDSYIADPFSISVLGDRIFWSDSSKGAIMSVNKHSGADFQYITGGLDHPRDIHVYRDYMKNETRRLFFITYLPRKGNNRFAECSTVCPAQSRFGEIPEPKSCPVGYKEANYGSSCSNCSDALGGNFKCECKDWKTCAQRGYASFNGCHPNKPFMMFKIRECIQVVKPGNCPYMDVGACTNTTDSCEADEDCMEDEKCCKTSCSKMCRKIITKTDHPCTKNNGGCSHLCVSADNSYKCMCKDGWHLDKDGKTCMSGKPAIITDICQMHSDHGPCHPRRPETRWFYNHNNKQCEQFSYGGCDGNKNNYKTKDDCEKGCGVVCPNFDGIFGPCVVKNTSCIVTATCPPGKLCCSKGCGKECVEPVKKWHSRCWLAKPTGICKPNAIRQWYFNKATSKCQPYTSYGCHTTFENSFDSQDECNGACDISICKLKPDAGPCKSRVPQWYFDWTKGRCFQFNYGGCQGNKNRFPTESECMNRCSGGSYNHTSQSTKPPVKTFTPIKTKTSPTKVTLPPPRTPPQTRPPPTRNQTTTAKTITTTTTTTTTATTTIVQTTATKTTIITTALPSSTKQPIITKFITPPNVPPTTAALDPCTPNPCKNGATCVSSPVPMCNCLNFFGGKQCEINMEKGVVSAKFTVKKKMTKDEFVRATASVLSTYCMQPENCFHTHKNRQRRRSVPYGITERHIQVFRYEQQSGNKVRADFAVLNPGMDGGPSFMATSELKSIVKQYSKYGGNSAGLYFDSFVEPTSPAVSGKSKDDPNKKGVKPVKVVIGVLFALVALSFIVGAMWYAKKRRFNKPPTATSDPGPVSFENQLYDDIHAGNKVELPVHSNEESPRYTIPTANVTNSLADYANVAAAEGHVLSEYEDSNHKKGLPSNWVQFTEDEEEKRTPEKHPITNFVQPAEYRDPYDLDGVLDPPPDYTSNTGTPSKILPPVEQSPVTTNLAPTTPRSPYIRSLDHIDVSTTENGTEC